MLRIRKGPRRLALECGLVGSGMRLWAANHLEDLTKLRVRLLLVLPRLLPILNSPPPPFRPVSPGLTPLLTPA